MEKDNQFIKVLDILEKEYGWSNMGALEKMQAELINDTIKATRMVVNKNFVKPVVSGSCLFIHKWTKWEQHGVNMSLVKDGKEYPYIKTIQTRKCLRCNKMQKEDI